VAAVMVVATDSELITDPASDSPSQSSSSSSSLSSSSLFVARVNFVGVHFDKTYLTLDHYFVTNGITLFQVVVR
jgi:hypothetical protein